MLGAIFSFISPFYKEIPYCPLAVGWGKYQISVYSKQVYGDKNVGLLTKAINRTIILVSILEGLLSTLWFWINVAECL